MTFLDDGASGTITPKNASGDSSQRGLGYTYPHEAVVAVAAAVTALPTATVALTQMIAQEAILCTVVAIDK